MGVERSEDNQLNSEQNDALQTNANVASDEDVDTDLSKGTNVAESINAPAATATVEEDLVGLSQDLNVTADKAEEADEGTNIEGDELVYKDDVDVDMDEQIDAVDMDQQADAVDMDEQVD